MASARPNHATPWWSPDAAAAWLQVRAGMLQRGRPSLTAFGQFVLSTAFLLRVCARVLALLQDARAFKPADPSPDSPLTAPQADERQAHEHDLWIGVLVDLLRLAAAQPEALGVVTHAAAEEYFFRAFFQTRGIAYQRAASNALLGRVSDARAAFETDVAARSAAALRDPNRVVTRYIRGPVPCIRTESGGAPFASDPREFAPSVEMRPTGPPPPLATHSTGVDPATYAQGLLAAERVVGRTQIVGRPIF